MYHFHFHSTCMYISFLRNFAILGLLLGSLDQSTHISSNLSCSEVFVSRILAYDFRKTTKTK